MMPSAEEFSTATIAVAGVVMVGGVGGLLASGHWEPTGPYLFAALAGAVAAVAGTLGYFAAIGRLTRIEPGTARFSATICVLTAAIAINLPAPDDWYFRELFLGLATLLFGWACFLLVFAVFGPSSNAEHGVG